MTTLTGAGKIAGVVGWPVGHSLSPLMHGFWLDELGLDGALVPLAVAREDFARVIAGLQRAGLAGVNVTVPHKQAALAMAAVTDDAAGLAGAANLLIFRPDGVLEGRNTDWLGLRESLSEAGVPVANRVVTLLGAGGAARGALLALAAGGARRVHILNRRPAKAQALAAALAKTLKLDLQAHAIADWPALAAGTDLLINATAAGMKGQTSLSLELDVLKTGAWVMDMVYNPLETELLRKAQAAGHPIVDGLSMLMHQAVPSFAAFFGVTPKVSGALRAALQRALDG
ncbi:MAG: shikimate dehydrogenase [Rhizomicrobium sp.]